LICLACLLLLTPARPALADLPFDENLANLSFEELASIKIFSVSRMPQPLNEVPAAIYVITHDDINKAGVTRMADILRLAPNLLVAQINASTFAITARGFNSAAAGKLLVLIDGRSVYTPFFSGVFWDVQEVPVATIDRIEVVSGPAGTTWGANAVNGVINVVTRRSAETQGGVLDLGGGNRERRGALAYGGRLSPDLTWRAYAEGVDYAHSTTPAGHTAADGWSNIQGGFRMDWAPAEDVITLQGDAYRAFEGVLGTDNILATGHNGGVRWAHPLANGDSIQIQLYYDSLDRSVAARYLETLRTYDIDLQHSFSWGSRQTIVWGGGYRLMRDNFPTFPVPGPTAIFSPTSRTLQLGNAFLEDSIDLTRGVKAILGTRLEDDAYAGIGVLPSLRLAWKADEATLLWAAVSRAARTPSRLDRDLYERIGSRVIIAPGNFQSEHVTAYEAGLRAAPIPNSTLSISAFYNVYDDLRSAELSPGGRYPVLFGNGMTGETYGVESWGSYGMTDWWRLGFGTSWFHKNLRFKPGSSRIGGLQTAGDDPPYQLSLRSNMALADTVTSEITLRRVGSLPAPVSPFYTELDARLGWSVTDAVEISLLGSNLLHAHHLEYGQTTASLQVGATGVETGRSFFVATSLKF
jgi:iron complex outermembrane receptor protein